MGILIREGRIRGDEARADELTGLHFDHVKQLLAILQRLVDAGNSVIVIDHNLEVGLSRCRPVVG